MTNPLVTICIPSYNYGRFLPYAVESVVRQSYPTFELLIIDNGSTDDSYAIAQSFAERDPRVQVLTHAGHENKGVNASLNLGLATARGAYFGLLPADDLFVDDGLERRVALLESSPDAGFAYGTTHMVDEEGRPTGHVGGRPPDDMLGFDRTDDLLHALLFHDFVPGASVLARVELLRGVGGFNDAVYLNDWYVTIRLLARTACVFVAGQPVVGYRLHQRHRATWNRDADRPRRLQLFRTLWALSATTGDRLEEPRVRALIALQRAVHAARLGEVDEATAAVVDALAADPSLGADAAYVLWWLDPRHGEWSLPLGTEERSAFLAAISSPSATEASLLSAGSNQTSFTRLVLEAAAESLTSEAQTEIAWSVLSDQLEALGKRAHPIVLLSLLVRVARQPSLVRQRSFVKAGLVSAGLWPLVATARRRAAARSRGN